MPKFSARLAIDGDERLARMRENMRRSIPRFEPQPIREGVLAVCGYGPSLAETWREIDTPHVCTVSGAHDFLIERGLVPTWHVEFDPRPHKATFLHRPHPRTTYCLASVCHPDVFAALAASKVLLWHALGGNEGADWDRDKDVVNEFEADGILFKGGSTAGLRAISLGHALGFRRFALYGLDCGYQEGKTWAGPHASKQHPMFRVAVNGREFWTSDVMLNAADELFDFVIGGMPGSQTRVHGNHLFAERIRLMTEQGIDRARGRWWQPVGWQPKVLIDGLEQRDQLISDEYRETLRWLHVIDPGFGNGGDKQAEQVALLMRMVGSDDVLDYGCGKQALRRKLPNVRGYDPGVAADCAKEPRPADIVVCTDVMEYVEEGSIDAVLRHIAGLSRRMVYFQIGLRPSVGYISEVPVPVVRDLRWWLEVLSQRFEFVGPTFGDRGHLRVFCVPRAG